MPRKKCEREDKEKERNMITNYLVGVCEYAFVLVEWRNIIYLRVKVCWREENEKREENHNEEETKSSKLIK